MTKFKVGDRVRALRNAYPYFTEGKEYTVSKVKYEDTLQPEYVFDLTDTGGPNYGRHGDLFELVEETPAFKVGDRVNYIHPDPTHHASWQNCEVKRTDDLGVWVDNPEGIEGYGDFRHWELAKEEPMSELEELREWKRQAIERFPQLAPVDPDLEEAHKIASAHSDGKWSSSTMVPGDTGWEGSVANLALIAIKRGRELAAQ